MATVRFEEAQRWYPGTDRPAVPGISLEIQDGEFMVLVGPSGCGKSTTLRMLAGLEEVNDGKIFIGDRDVTKMAPKDRDIAMVFQNYALYPHMTVADNMAFALKMAKMPAEERKKRVDDAAKILGLTEFLERKPKALSGGQRQAVSLLMATTGDTRVLLLDEHTAALDPKTAEFVMELTCEIVASLKLTTVMVTHSMAQALQFGTRTIMFHRGRIVFDVSGERRVSMTVADLLDLFKRDLGEELADDALLLG